MRAMEKFTTLTAVAAPFRWSVIDTDMIIPKQFLKTIQRSGLGKALFDEMRRTPDGNDVPTSVLNKPAYKDAKILVAGANFGCGSSREHAPRALLDYGSAASSRPLRRHLLRQLLQERHPADRPAAVGNRQAAGRRRAQEPTRSSASTWRNRNPRPRRRRHRLRDRPVPQADPDERLGRHHALTLRDDEPSIGAYEERQAVQALALRPVLSWSRRRTVHAFSGPAWRKVPGGLARTKIPQARDDTTENPA